MSDNGEGVRSGFGAAAPDEARVPRRAPVENGPAGGVDTEDLLREALRTSDHINRDALALRAGLDEAQIRIDAAEARLAQIETTSIANHHRAIQSLIDNIATLEARQNALAAQVARNLRVVALNAAVQCRQPGENADRVLAMTERFMRYLDPPAEPPVPAEDGASAAPSTQH